MNALLGKKDIFRRFKVVLIDYDKYFSHKVCGNKVELDSEQLIFFNMMPTFVILLVYYRM